MANALEQRMLVDNDIESRYNGFGLDEYSRHGTLKIHARNGIMIDACKFVSPKFWTGFNRTI